MSVIVRPDGWYSYSEDGSLYLCGSCVLADLEKTRKGELAGEEAITLDMVERLADDIVKDGVQCDSCLDQSDNYPGPEDDDS